MNETAYLLRSPVNGARLIAAAKRSKRSGKSFKSVKALRDVVGL
jgi:PHD/YefM family antitoxin component YafN of YafNO toxin-antitoxin module